MEDSARLPLREPDPETLEHLRRLGAPVLNLYRTLANHPALLKAWIDFLWSLRLDCSLPRGLRELVILRSAQLFGSDYEWIQHVRLALAFGVSPEQLEALQTWRLSPQLFTDAERAALAYAEAVHAGRVGADVHADAAGHFNSPELIELALTCSAYAMVARFLEAMRVPLEASDPWLGAAR